ncbi:transposable element Tcb2 transposase [Trichonephila clavipes]|nr:transposable element Tcb2 transposase [Trichonephila clavipes]
MQIIDGCICNGLMSTVPGKLIGTKLSFQMNHASVSWDHDDRNCVRRYAAAFQRILGAIFLQDNYRPHASKTVRDFCSTQHMQLLPWPAYSPDMSPTEHVGDLVCRRLARDPRPAASKD